MRERTAIIVTDAGFAITRLCAYGIVHSDQPGARTDTAVRSIQDLARRSGRELRAIVVVRPGSDLSLLLAGLPSNGIGAVFVPSVIAMTGWLDVAREIADVWTAVPPGYWPRRDNGGPAAFIPVSGATS
ncbi:hypothetical protein D7D52_23560 [Nocardia yunnanensis]|uniref:Uncharacterized protein n=1 Tax=Nocardia yunnanensis TaxID=2382165 RepID=A0A386ZFP9_9NOCA|nr:hypothetical protein [Nocardia yunnanensis]AYF76310.1 hypothetical protein D7D52_23560 [Nocardia yunnanensis]